MRGLAYRWSPPGLPPPAEGAHLRPALRFGDGWRATGRLSECLNRPKDSGWHGEIGGTDLSPAGCCARCRALPARDARPRDKLGRLDAAVSSGQAFQASRHSLGTSVPVADRPAAQDHQLVELRAGAGPAVPIDPSELKSRSGTTHGTLFVMTGLKIGYAPVSPVGQDLTAQRDGLALLGVDAGRVYVDHGLTGTTRARPGLREALAACRTGDTLVVTKL